MTTLSCGRFMFAVLGAALAGAVWPSETVFLTAHAALLFGGVKLVHALEH